LQEQGHDYWRIGMAVTDHWNKPFKRVNVDTAAFTTMSEDPGAENRFFSRAVFLATNISQDRLDINRRGVVKEGVFRRHLPRCARELSFDYTPAQRLPEGFSHLLHWTGRAFLQVRDAPLLLLFCLNHDELPRQAQDKSQENSEAGGLFAQSQRSGLDLCRAGV
jgi:hypothetical protein